MWCRWATPSLLSARPPGLDFLRFEAPTCLQKYISEFYDLDLPWLVGIPGSIGQDPDPGAVLASTRFLCCDMGDAVNDKDSIARKIVLRLDDGSLIGDSNSLLGNGASGVVLLDCERACSLGRVSQDDLERLDALVQAYQGKVPDLYSLPRASLKSSNPYAHEVTLDSCVHALPPSGSLSNISLPYCRVSEL